MHAAKTWLLLVVASPVVKAAIGFSTGRSFIELSEYTTQHEICVNSSEEMTFGFVVFQSRSALATEDYIDRPVNLNSNCFNISIVDDDKYERREEFLVNLTTPDQGILHSSLTIVILDDDILQINWVVPEYTVREEDKMVEVCATLTGTYSGSRDSRPTLDVMTIEDSAKEEIDYIPTRPGLSFEVGDSGLSRCYSIMIIADIEFKEDREFAVNITVPSGLDRIDISPAVRVIIIDYNVIVKQQPQSVCEGLQNLLNTTLPENISCSVKDCVQLKCMSHSVSFSVYTTPCNNMTVIVSVTARNGATVILNETLYSRTEPQVLNYYATRGTEILESLTVSIEVVKVANESQYYILSLNSSSGIHLPMTAIPVLADCTGLMMAKQSVPGYILLGATAVGSTIVMMIISLLLIFLLSRNEQMRQKITAQNEVP